MADPAPKPPTPEIKLPSWLKRTERPGKRFAYVLDPDVAYPLVLSALGVEEKDYDQYWIEVAYQCSKMAAIELVGWGPDIIIDSSGDRKKDWALAEYPKGKGIYAASKGLEAKEHYRKIARALGV